MFLKIIYIFSLGEFHITYQPADKVNCSSRLEPGGARYLRAGLTKCKLLSKVNTLKSVSSAPSTEALCTVLSIRCLRTCAGHKHHQQKPEAV